MSTPFTLDYDPVFEPVADVFRASFEEGKELGASFVIYKGWADRRKTVPVTNETLFAVFSSGKVPAALVIAWLVDQDRIGYDQLAASIWPEFGVNGKEEQIQIGRLPIGSIGTRQPPSLRPKPQFFRRARTLAINLLPMVI